MGARRGHNLFYYHRILLSEPFQMPTIANTQISIFHCKLQRGNLSSFLVETFKICPVLGTGFVSFPGIGYPKDATFAFEAAETISKWEY